MQKGATPVIMGENSFTKEKKKRKKHEQAPARFSTVAGEQEKSARFTSLYVC